MEERKVKEIQKVPHLKGGAADTDKRKTDMISRAIANASSHGINLHGGVKNLANGNCAFESIIDSINTRPEFQEVLDGNPDFWRKKWMTHVEAIGFDNWNGGLSKREWIKGWKVLKMPGVYEHKLGDLVLPGIAHCTQKDILIFNTSMDAHRPIFVVEASKLCGQVANTEVPILLAYDQYHYEMLLPDNPEDIQKTIDLKHQFLSGIYDRKMEDIALCTVSKKSVKQIKSKKCEIDSASHEPPSLKKRKLQKILENDVEEDEKLLQYLKKLGAKKRSGDQNKEYNKLRERRRLKLKRLSMTETQKNATKEKEKITKRNYRKTQSKEIKDKERDKDKTAKKQRKKTMMATNPLFGLAATLDTVDFDENENNLFKYQDIGCLFDQPICGHCHAYRWPYPLESQNFCCKEGKVLQSVQPYKDPPRSLCELLQEKVFCENIKEYNNALAFASLGTDKVPEAGPNYKILGKLHHRIGTIGMPTEDKPKFAQLYFYDQANETQNRLDHQKKKLKPHIMKTLQEMVHQNNPYVKSLKAALDICSDENNLKLVLYADSKLKPKDAHTRSYNLPIGSEVAVLLPGQQIGDLDVILHTHGNQLQQINSVHRSYDPLHYVLLLPFGQDGFQPKLPMGKGHVSVNQFYAFHIQVRKDNFNLLLRCHKLSQQYLADMYAKVERGRLNWVYLNQKTIKVERYKGLIDAKDNGDINDVGKTTILPPTITGSPRWYVERYQDAMCIVRNEGKPDIFVTFTCNTMWPEIQQSLFPGESAFDRPDICARVFKMKSDALVKDIVKNGIMGLTTAHVYTIEWQKRKGLPHMHLLVTLHADSKVHDAKDIDKFISAEIPDPVKTPRLHKAVMKHMIHGPCGKHFPNSPCMEAVGNSDVKICSKDFPKAFQLETEVTEYSYPIYRRRAPKDGGRTAEIERRGKVITIDNQSVVPYNPVLLLKYDSHINVEFLFSVVSVKYLYKYISKGPDRIVMKITPENKELENDEVAKYQNCRYLSASESAWKLLNQPIHGRSHSVLKLTCHLEQEQCIMFEEGSALQALEAGEPETMLTAWFKKNQEDPEARLILYPDFPKHYTWINGKKEWKVRQRGSENMFGRVPCVPFNIHTMELYCLRILLHHVPGAVDYNSLKTVNGVRCETFQAACIELGLLDDEKELDKAMNEAFLIQFGEQLRCLFLSILVFVKPSNPLKFWETHKENLAEDWTKDNGAEKAVNMVLFWLKSRLQLNGIELKSLGLPEPVDLKSDIENVGSPLVEELNFDKEEQKQLTIQKVEMMNQDQSNFFDMVLESINKETGTLFFLDAPGGTGKTFVLNALLSAVRSDGQIAIGTAISAVASKLLSNGSTVHSKLKVPIQIKETSFCNFSKADGTGKLLLKTKLLIIDEVSMGHKHIYEAIDRTMRELKLKDTPFGGLTVVFSGDWRQCLPVIVNGSEGQICDACLKFSYLWKYVKIAHLSENMRVKLSGATETKRYAEFLLSVGNGTTEEGDLINMPEDMMTEQNSIEELTQFVFPDIEKNHIDPNWLGERAILCPTNNEADEINDYLTDKFPGMERVYKSCDSTDDFNQEFQSEFINTLNLPGMPPHKLILKKGMSVMLLRNLDPKNGHCNGVKYTIQNMQDHIIQAMAISGSNPGAKLFIPRITLISTTGSLPFTMRRKQFPVRQAFAMTANKAQGQTLAKVGIYLGQDFFSHGQLYVALSRCGNREGVKILKRQQRSGKTVRNVVYRSVLSK